MIVNEDEDLISMLNQDDPRLIKVIQNWFLEPLPNPETPYKFSVPNPETKGQIGVPPLIDQLLGGKQNGFFIGEDFTPFSRIWKTICVYMSVCVCV
jgi:hypothetical protein